MQGGGGSAKSMLQCAMLHGGLSATSSLEPISNPNYRQSFKSATDMDPWSQEKSYHQSKRLAPGTIACKGSRYYGRKRWTCISNGNPASPQQHAKVRALCGAHKSW